MALSQTVVMAPEEMEKIGRPRKRFKVAIDNKLCKGCYFCVRYCPMGVFSKSEEFGATGYTIAKVEHPEKCKGCRICLLYCPDLAVAVEEERAEEK